MRQSMAQISAELSIHLVTLHNLRKGWRLQREVVSSWRIICSPVCLAFHGRVIGPVWPAEDSHLPWTDLRGQRQPLRGTSLPLA
jgi:hypothetical protein